MPPRLDSLLNRWIDGELSPPEMEAVQRMLTEDAEARHVCYELLMVDRLLEEKHDLIEEDTATMDVIACHSASGGTPRRPRFGWFAAAAAAVILTLLGLFFSQRADPVAVVAGSPHITGSTDSRITIAQRQDVAQWSVGELLRLQRGTANIQLNPHLGLNLDGPAAIELLDHSGNVRLVEGIASFSVLPGTGNTASVIHVPGGRLRSLDSRYIIEVLANGDTNIQVESGFLEILPNRPALNFYLKSGDSICLNPDGSHTAIRLPDFQYRADLPKQMTLFREDFEVNDLTDVDGHVPPVGRPWQVLSEVNPTLIRNQRLDTSSGARRIVADLLDHDSQGPRAVYIFSFDLLPPEWLFDKIKRRDGIENITLRDADGNRVVSIIARATNSHRWQLEDERSKAVTALTPVSALWTHSLTICYGLDGWVTLHDGATAQSPIIAELRLEYAPHVSDILIENDTGGDLAFDRMEVNLLPSPMPDDL